MQILYLLKVSKFQNEFMKSSFLLKYEPNKCKDFCPVLCHKTGQRSFYIFCSCFGCNDDFVNSFWNLLTFKYVLWCCSSICCQILISIHIGSGHTVSCWLEGNQRFFLSFPAEIGTFSVMSKHGPFFSFFFLLYFFLNAILYKDLYFVCFNLGDDNFG